MLAALSGVLFEAHSVLCGIPFAIPMGPNDPVGRPPVSANPLRLREP